MQFRALVCAAALLMAPVLADGPASWLPKEYPRGECATLCGPVVTASVRCGDNGLQSQNCICDYPGMKKKVPQCQKCSQEYKSDSEYTMFANQMTTLLNTCGFPKSQKEYSAAAGLGAPAMGAGVIAAAAAFAAL